MFTRRKQTYPLSDILKGLQQAINSSQEILQVQQLQNLSKFWTPEGEPLVQEIKVNEKEMSVPLITLLPHNNLVMDDVEIKFNTKVGGIVSESSLDQFNSNDTLTHANLKMEMEGIKADAEDVMSITIKFKTNETSEGMARLIDEYNKKI